MSGGTTYTVHENTITTGVSNIQDAINAFTTNYTLSGAKLTAFNHILDVLQNEMTNLALDAGTAVTTFTGGRDCTRAHS